MHLPEELRSFKQLVDYCHEQVHMKWVPLPMDLNADGQKWHLGFVAGSETMFAKNEGDFVTDESFAEIVSAGETECADKPSPQLLWSILD